MAAAFRIALDDRVNCGTCANRQRNSFAGWRCDIVQLQVNSRRVCDEWRQGEAGEGVTVAKVEIIAECSKHGRFSVIRKPNKRRDTGSRHENDWRYDAVKC